MFSFTKETLQLLRNAGWDEHRKYPIVSEYFKALEYEGFHISDAVKEFLYHFGGLSIKHPHAKIKEKIDYFHFDVIKALNSGDTSWVLDEYSSRIGKELCIIGEAFRRSLILCMSPDKNVYAGIDNALFFVGNSGESAIEVLCHGDSIEAIPEQDREEKFEASSLEAVIAENDPSFYWDLIQLPYQDKSIYPNYQYEIALQYNEAETFNKYVRL